MQHKKLSPVSWKQKRWLVMATGEAQERVLSSHLIARGHPEAKRAGVTRRAAMPVHDVGVRWAASNACRELLAMKTFALSVSLTRAASAHAAVGVAAVLRVRWLSKQTAEAHRKCQGCKQRNAPPATIMRCIVVHANLEKAAVIV